MTSKKNKTVSGGMTAEELVRTSWKHIGDAALVHIVESQYFLRGARLAGLPLTGPLVSCRDVNPLIGIYTQARIKQYKV